MSETSRYQIIDALGAFVVYDYDDNEVINWSKVDFSRLQKNGRVPKQVRDKIVARLDSFLSRVKQQGYTAISIDDLAHMVVFEWYSPELSRLVRDYQLLYQQVISTAKSHGLMVMVNTDLVFWNDEIRSYLGRSGHDTTDLFKSACELLAAQMDGIRGVIVRVGEHDGRDVDNEFTSQLALRTPAAANTFLKRVLPVFEARHMTMVFRTWTVGVYRLGDLIWNEKTYDAVFGDIESDNLVISMKYGDTDFMRYLELNPLFFHGHHKKILELQTRREWEGMGQLPSFVGWDYERYISQLAALPNFVGIQVWCQTGGWARATWRNLTYLENSSFWVELNTEVTADIYRRKLSVEEAVRLFCERRKISDTATVLDILRSSDIAVKKGLYIPELASRSLYFRRTRLPTLLWLVWDKADISQGMLRLLRSVVRQPSRAIMDARSAYRAALHMQKEAKKLELDTPTLDSIALLVATMRLFVHIKTYMFGQHMTVSHQALNKAMSEYRQEYPAGYEIVQVALPSRYHRIPVGFAIRGLLRDTKRYRRRDRLLLKTSRVQRALVRYSMRGSSLKDQSMGIDSLFK